MIHCVEGLFKVTKIAIECWFLFRDSDTVFIKRVRGLDSGMTLTKSKLIGAKEMINIQKSY
jgi:hypothetical protein